MDREMINPIEFIDKSKMINPISIITEKNPEEKTYLLLYVGEYEDEEIKSFEIIEGRTAIYEYVKNIADHIDIHESKILVEGLELEKMVSVYEFMSYAKSHYFADDDFDIEDYNIVDTNNTEEV